MKIYVVAGGDTVYKIAGGNPDLMEEIIYANQLVPPYPLAVGQALLIPSQEEAKEKRLARIISKTGYCGTHCLI